MNVDDLTIKQAREISAMFGLTEKPKDILSHLIGKKVLIRDNNAGVFITTLSDIKGSEWVGLKSRKIHYWDKAGAVEGVAETGLDLQNSRITVATDMSCGKSLIQICLVSDEIFEKIMEASPWNPK